MEEQVFDDKNPFLITKAPDKPAKAKTVYTADDFDDLSPVSKKKVQTPATSAPVLPTGGENISSPAQSTSPGFSPVTGQETPFNFAESSNPQLAATVDAQQAANPTSDQNPFTLNDLDRVTTINDQIANRNLKEYLQTQNTPEAQKMLADFDQKEAQWLNKSPLKRMEDRYAAAGGKAQYEKIQKDAYVAAEKTKATRAENNKQEEKYDNLPGFGTDFEKNTARYIRGGLGQLIGSAGKTLTETASGALNMVRDAPISVGGIRVNPITDKPKLYDENGQKTEYAKSLTWQSPLDKFILSIDGMSDMSNAMISEETLPNTTGGRLTTSMAQIAPDIAAMMFAPEVKAAEGLGALGKAKNLVWNPFTKYMLGKGALTGYSDAKREGGDGFDATIGSAKGAAEGAATGATVGILGGIAGEFSKNVTHDLVRSGILSLDNHLTKAGIRAMSEAVTFGGAPVVEAYAKSAVTGEDVDKGKLLDEMINQAGIGAAFGAKAGIKEYNTSKQEYGTYRDLVDNVLPEMQKNAFASFLRADMDVIGKVATTVNNSGDLHAKGVELVDKSSREPEEAKRNEMLANAALNMKLADIKGITDVIVNNKQDVIDFINGSDLTNEAKDLAIKKVRDVADLLSETGETKRVESEKVQTAAETTESLADQLVNATTPEAVAEVKLKAEQAFKEGVEASQKLEDTVKSEITLESQGEGKKVGDEIAFKNESGEETTGFIKEITPEGKAVVGVNTDGIYSEQTIDLLLAGQEAVLPEQQPIDDSIDFVNKTPEELAKLYSEEVNTPSVSNKELAIASMPFKVNRESYINFGDKNNITSSKARSYFSADGLSVDQIAQEINNAHFNGEETVTPDDIINFIDSRPNGPQTISQPSGNEKLRKINDAYFEKTGKKLNSKTAANIAKKYSVPEPVVQEAIDAVDAIEPNIADVIDRDLQFSDGFTSPSEAMDIWSNDLDSYFENPANEFNLFHGVFNGNPITQEQFDTFKNIIDERKINQAGSNSGNEGLSGGSDGGERNNGTATGASSNAGRPKSSPRIAKETVENFKNRIDEVADKRDGEIFRNDGNQWTHLTNRPETIKEILSTGMFIGKGEDLASFTKDVSTKRFNITKENGSAPYFQKGRFYGDRNQKYLIVTSGDGKFTPNIFNANTNDFNESKGVGVLNPENRDLDNFDLYVRNDNDGEYYKIDVDRIKQDDQTTTDGTASSAGDAVATRPEPVVEIDGKEVDLSKTSPEEDAKIIINSFGGKSGVVQVSINPLSIISGIQKMVDKMEHSVSEKYIPRLTDAIAEKLKAWRQSKSTIKQMASSYASSIFGGIARTDKDTNMKLGLVGGKNMAVYNMGKVMKSLYGLVDNNVESLERVHVVLDPDFYQHTGQSSALSPHAPPNLKYADLTPEEKSLYDELRKNLDDVHFKNYALGFIDVDTFNKYKGKYVPRMYETFELPDEIKADLDRYQEQVGDKLNLNPFKKRKGLDDLSDESKNAILKDPVYLVAKRMMELDTNSAVMTYINHINRNMKSVVYQGDTPPKNFVKMEGKAYGALDGKYIPSYLAEDLRGYFFVNKALNNIYDVMKGYDRTWARQAVKKGLTVFNPFVQIGNFTSNVVFAQMAGIDFVRWFGNTPKALKSLKAQDQDYLDLLEAGLVGSETLAKDLLPNTRKSTSMLQTAQAKRDASLLRKVLAPLQKANDAAMNLYSGNDDYAKINAYQIFRDQGYTKEEALKKVYDGFQNYATVGKFWDVVSKLPVFGNPFQKFSADLARITTNAATKKPLSTALYIAGLYMLPQLLKQIGASDDDEDDLEKELREGRPFIPKMDLGVVNVPLVYKTKIGELNLARYVTPYYFFDNGEDGALSSMASRFNPYKSVKAQGYGKGNESQRPFGQDPVAGTIYNIIMDTDFRGKSIQDPEATRFRASGITDEQKWVNRATNALRTWIPNGSLVHDTYLNAKYGEDFYGRSRTIAQTLINFAVKIQDFKDSDYQKTAEKQVYSMTNDIKSQAETIKNTYVTDARQRQALTTKFKDGKIDQSDLQNSLEKLDTQLRDRIDQATKAQAELQKKLKDFTAKYESILKR